MKWLGVKFEMEEKMTLLNKRILPVLALVAGSFLSSGDNSILVAGKVSVAAHRNDRRFSCWRFRRRDRPDLR